MKKLLFVVSILVGLAPVAAAEVVRVEIARRADVGTSGYEKLVGTIYFAVDPAHPRNAVVVDLDKARKNGQGLVEFSADVYILQPKDAARRNGVALVEVSNRGNKGLLSGFARASGGGLDPTMESHLGDGFLTAQGYTLVWVGWQFDVARDGGMKLHAPVAIGTSGIVRADFIANERQTEAVFVDLARYTPADVSAADTALTVRDGAYGEQQTLPRAQWQLNGNVVTMADGFEPGKTYQLSYRSRDLPVTGTGLVAFRDTASWLKHQPDANARVRYAYAFGSSQSGRFLRSFLYHGFNSDEKNRIVYDGVMAHIAGAGRISINERGAIPNANAASNVTNFPFTNASARDPITGRSEGLLENDRARQNQPKIFFTNSAVEYLEHTGGRAHTHDARWQRRCGAARQHADLLPFRNAAFAGTVPSETNHRPAARQPRAVLVDAPRPVDCDGQLGAHGQCASGQPIPEVERRHARSPRRHHIPGDSGSAITPADSICPARLHSPAASGTAGR